MCIEQHRNDLRSLEGRFPDGEILPEGDPLRLSREVGSVDRSDGGVRRRSLDVGQEDIFGSVGPGGDESVEGFAEERSARRVGIRDELRICVDARRRKSELR